MRPLSGFFISASDTGAGKTYVACQLAAALHQAGQRVAVRKPIESGCARVDDRLIAADARALGQAAGNWEAIETICPHPFEPALSPPRAARFSKRKIFLTDLLAACVAPEQADTLLVEGAGGWFAPLAEDALNADLAAALKLSVILVVPDRLGAINQALLAIHAVTHRGLHLAAVVLNQRDAEQPRGMNNYADLRLWTGAPILRLGYQDKAEALLAQLQRLQACNTRSIS